MGAGCSGEDWSFSGSLGLSYLFGRTVLKSGDGDPDDQIDALNARMKEKDKKKGVGATLAEQRKKSKNKIAAANPHDPRWDPHKAQTDQANSHIKPFQPGQAHQGKHGTRGVQKRSSTNDIFDSTKAKQPEMMRERSQSLEDVRAFENMVNRELKSRAKQATGAAAKNQTTGDALEEFKPDNVFKKLQKATPAKYEQEAAEGAVRAASSESRRSAGSDEGRQQPREDVMAGLNQPEEKWDSERALGDKSLARKLNFLDKF